MARCDIVQEKQRFRALGQNIVDAHGYAVDTDRVMTIQLLGDQKLGPHAIRTRNQNRMCQAGNRG